jgi:serine/threonine protein kinase
MKGRSDPSFSTLLTAGYYLADSYHYLHASGWTYCDINFGNVFFDPQNGDVLICDNDNVTVDRLNNSQVAGTLGFMAPEIVRREKGPSSDTDRFSLAVLLFYMLFISHPLEGKKESAIKCFDQPAKEKLYGYEPVFIFDPNNDSNRPDPKIHKNALIYWNIYPQSLKDLFIKSFTDGLKDPQNGRVRETTWRNTLLKIRDMIVYCQKCKLENFFDVDQLQSKDLKSIKCWNCKKDIILPPRMKISNNILMLNYNTKIYPYHLDNFTFTFEKPVAEITQNPNHPEIWGLKNMSERNWLATKPDGSTIEIIPGKNIALANGLKINFGKAEGEIRT